MNFLVLAVLARGSLFGDAFGSFENCEPRDPEYREVKWSNPTRTVISSNNIDDLRYKLSRLNLFDASTINSFLRKLPFMSRSNGLAAYKFSMTEKNFDKGIRTGTLTTSIINARVNYNSATRTRNYEVQINSANVYSDAKAIGHCRKTWRDFLVVPRVKKWDKARPFTANELSHIYNRLRQKSDQLLK